MCRGGGSGGGESRLFWGGGGGTGVSLLVSGTTARCCAGGVSFCLITLVGGWFGKRARKADDFRAIIFVDRTAFNLTKEYTKSAFFRRTFALKLQSPTETTMKKQFVLLTL